MITISSHYICMYLLTTSWNLTTAVTYGNCSKTAHLIFGCHLSVYVYITFNICTENTFNC